MFVVVWNTQVHRSHSQAVMLVVVWAHKYMGLIPRLSCWWLCRHTSSTWFSFPGCHVGGCVGTQAHGSRSQAVMLVVV